MTSGRSDIVDVTLELRQDDPAKKAIAFFDGRMDENKREIWTWLPRSQIEFEPAGFGNKAFVVSLPEWLAKEKELI